MAFKVDEKWLSEYARRTGIRVPDAAETEGVEHGRKRSKYGNARTETEDGTFDSKHEAQVWEELKLRARAGEIRAIARQAVFYLPGGVKYIADFAIWNADGSTDVLDAKSEATRKDKVYRIKKRLMMAEHGIEIREV